MKLMDLSKKAVAEDGIGQEEDHVVINILRKGKDISENDKIKGIIERYQKKRKKKIETILLDMKE